MRITNTYQENNKHTSTFSTDGEILANYFSSIQNGKAVQGVTEFSQHFGVSVEKYLNGTGEFIISGHVTISDANFTPGEKVAANTFGTIGTIDKVDGSPFSRVGGVVFIIGIALTDKTFYMQFEHTKPLVQLLVEGRKFMLEIFTQLDHRAPSIAFPAICLSRLHPADSKTVTLDAVNWVEFVPALRGISWKVAANVSNIPYSGFTPGIVTEITLDAANTTTINTPLLKKIESLLRYHNDLVNGVALTGSHFLNTALTLNFQGYDCVIIDINRITETITVDFDSTALTSSSGDSHVYPSRLRNIAGSTAITENESKAQLRKLKPETSIASGYSSGELLPFQFQGHHHDHSSVSGFHGVGSEGRNSGVNDFVGLTILAPTTDGVNGDPQFGESTHGNLMSAYVYIFGGRYVP